MFKPTQPNISFPTTSPEQFPKTPGLTRDEIMEIYFREGEPEVKSRFRLAMEYLDNNKYVIAGFIFVVGGTFIAYNN